MKRRDKQTKIKEILGDDFFLEMKKLIPNHSPNMDIIEFSSEILVIIELPGIRRSKDNISIKLNGFTLIIEGIVPFPYQVEERAILQEECFSGHFERRIPLPQTIAREQIQSFYSDGLLEIHIPKAQRSGE